jgi:hypothetical protein
MEAVSFLDLQCGEGGSLDITILCRENPAELRLLTHGNMREKLNAISSLQICESLIVPIKSNSLNNNFIMM